MDGKREEQLNRGLLEFIQESPSVFHVIENLKKRLEKAGFAERREQDSWELQPGGSYYVIRNGSSLIAGGCRFGRGASFQRLSHCGGPQ